MTHVQFLLLGLGNGAVFAALALALVMTFRSSGVVNFATSSVGLYSAYTYASLRRTGDLLVLVPGLPERVSLGGAMGLVPAAALALVVSALLGLVLYVAVFRPLRTAPPVASAVASLGVMLLLQALMALRLGTSPVAVQAIFPEGTFRLGSVEVPADRLWFAGTVVAVTALLVLAMRFTRFGVATRAVAETEVGAIISGLSPVRIAAANWMLSSAVAGLAGILIAPIVPLAPVAYALFIVPSLAAALFGGFGAIAPAVAGGLMLGMLQSEALYLQATASWAPTKGFPELISLAVILLMLLLRGRPLPTRGALIQQTLGKAPRPRSFAPPALAGTAAGALGLLLLEGTWRGALLTSIVMGIITLSLVVVTGYAGQVSLAQLTIAGAAGFLLSGLTTDWSVPFPFAPLLAALGAAAIGVVVGLPALRIRGLSVGIVTLALAVTLEAFWFRNNDLNGGITGAHVEGPTLFGLDLTVGVGKEFPRLPFAFLCLAVLVVGAFGVAKLRASRLGSAMLAVRANERSAAAAGVDVVRTKLAAFAIGAFIAGLGGALLAYMRTVVTAESYGIFAGLGLFVTAYIAGITSVAGGIFAGLLVVGGLNFVALDRWLSLGEWYDVVTSVFLVFTVIANPEGIVGHPQALVARWRARQAARAPRAAPPVAPAQLEPEVTRSVAPSLARVALSVRDVRVSYGGLVAVDSVSFDVPEGAIVGLIGPNGAGKTTLIDAISGFSACYGSVLLDGRPLDGLRPHRRVRAGLGRTFQAIEIYDDLTVTENVLVGESAVLRRGGGRDGAVDRTLDLLGLGTLGDLPAGDLSHGRRQLVSIARALVSRPTVLLLDEPAGGLDTSESAWLSDRLRSVRDAGATILLVDHDMNLVLGLCDQIVVLDFGRVIASGPPEMIRSDPAVAKAYLGQTHAHVEA